MADYKIELGVALDTSDLRTEINKIDGKHKVKLGVDVGVNDIRKRISEYNKNANNAKLHLKVKLDTDDLKQQINQLNLGGKGTGKGVSIPVNTNSLETSLKEVKSIIADIKTSIGSLDSGSGMKSLLSSINQIGSALDKASDKFDVLNTSLNSLASKDFNINLGLNVGGSNNPIARNAAYGNKVRGETLPQLKQQLEAYERYLKEYYKTADGFNAIAKLLSGGVSNRSAGDFMFEMYPTATDNNQSLSNRMNAYKNIIALIKESANLKGVDISGIEAQFSKSADELVKDAQDIQTGAKEAKEGIEQLKGVFGASIDAEGLSTALEPIANDIKEISGFINKLSENNSIDGLTASFNRLSEVLETLTTNLKTAQDILDNIRNVNNIGGSGLDTTVSDSGTEKAVQDQKELAQAIKQTTNEAKNLDNISIDVDVSDGDINDIKNALRSMKVDDSGIEEATKELNELNIIAKNVSATFKNGQLAKVDIKGVETAVDGLERAVTVTTTFGEKGATSSKKYSQALNEVAVEAEKVHNKLNDTGANGFAQEVNKAHVEAQRFEDTTGDLTVALQRLDAAYKEINLADQAGDQRALVSANKEYIESLKQVNSQIKLNQEAEKLVALKQKAQLKLDGLFGDNSEAARRFATELNRIQKELNECGSTTGVRNLISQMNTLAKSADNAQLKTQTFGQKFKKQWQQYSSYLSVASVFMYVEQGLRSMFEQVKLIDSAMTELKKVTDETDATYNQFLTNAASRAKEIGTTIDGLVSSTADFARLGYDFVDAQGLAEVANIYAVVGDEIEGVEGATQSLISTLTAFKDEMNGMSDSDFALSIVDKMNEVSNNFAISSGGIGEALQRSASSMQAANNTLDETIALITAAM